MQRQQSGGAWIRHTLEPLTHAQQNGQLAILRNRRDDVCHWYMDVQLAPTSSVLRDTCGDGRGRRLPSANDSVMAGQP